MDSSSVFITVGYYVVSLEEKLSWPAASPNPQRKGNYLIEFMSVLLGLSTLAVILRLYTRAFLIYKLGIDDLLIIPGYLAAIGVNVSEIYSLKAGWGLHVWDFDLNNARLLTISGYCVQITITFSCLFTKLSLLVSYLRFSPPRMKFWVYATMIFTVSWTLGCIIPCIVSCNPPFLYWDRYIRTPEENANCLSPYSIRLLQYLLCGFNLLSDVIMMILPIPTVWGLELPRRQKISVLAIFFAWIIVIAAAVLRLAYSLSTFPDFDTLWNGYDLWVYVTLEAHLAVICACAPGFKPLIIKIWPKFDKIRFARKPVLNNTTGTEHGDQFDGDVEINAATAECVESRMTLSKIKSSSKVDTEKTTASETVRRIIRSELGS